MTKRQQLAISFFLSRALFLGGGLANIITLSQKDSWISALFGILIGIIIIYLIHLFSSNQPLNKYLSDKKIINYTIKTIYVLLCSFITFICLLALTNLFENYYLPLTPPWIISFSFISICIYSLIKGYTTFIRVIEVLFPISIIIVIIKTTMLIPSMHFNNFLPLLTVENNNLFVASLKYAVISTTPFLLIIDEHNSLKNKIINYIIGTLSTLIILISVIAVLGYPLIQILSYPEYAILRKIEFLNFIENIENIIAFIWFIDLFALLTMSSFCIKKITNKKIAIIILLLITTIFNLFIIKDYDIVIIIYNNYLNILFILLIISLLLLA